MADLLVELTLPSPWAPGASGAVLSAGSHATWSQIASASGQACRIAASWLAFWIGPCSARKLRIARACSGPMPGSSRSSAGFARLTLTRFDMGASLTKRTPEQLSLIRVCSAKRSTASYSTSPMSLTLRGPLLTSRSAWRRRNFQEPCHNERPDRRLQGYGGPQERLDEPIRSKRTVGNEERRFIPERRVLAVVDAKVLVSSRPTPGDRSLGARFVVAELDRHDCCRLTEPDDQIEVVVAEPAAVRLALVEGFAQHDDRVSARSCRSDSARCCGARAGSGDSSSGTSARPRAPRGPP